MGRVQIGLISSLVLACGSPVRSEVDTHLTSPSGAGDDDGDDGLATTFAVGSSGDDSAESGAGDTTGIASTAGGDGGEGDDDGGETSSGAHECGGHPCPVLLDPIAANDVLVVDMTGDSKLDIVIATNAGVRVLPSKGDGTFFQPIALPTPGPITTLRPVSSHAAVLGGDLQVAAVCPAQNTVLIYRSGDGFGLVPPVEVTGYEPLDALGLTKTSDGDADLIVAEASSGTLAWWERTTAGALPSEPRRLLLGGSPARLAALRLDTGDVRIAVLDRSGGVRVVEVDESLTITADLAVPVDASASDLMWGAFGGQGPGLVIVSPGNSRLVQYTKDGSGWIEATSIVVSGAPTRVAPVWYPEGENPMAFALSLREADAVAIVPWSDDNHLLQPPLTTYATAIGPVALEGRRDLDGNGHAELVVASPTEGTWITWDAW